MSDLPAIYTKREAKLIAFIRELGWGEVKIRVENGQPVLIYEAIRTFRLEENEGDKKQRAKKSGVTQAVPAGRRSGN